MEQHHKGQPWLSILNLLIKSVTLRKALLIFSIRLRPQSPVHDSTLGVAFVLLLLFGSGCVTAPPSTVPKNNKPDTTYSRVYFGSFEEVELALKQAMIRYPQRIDNTEAGIFETDVIKGEFRFQPAHQTVSFSSGYRYRILVRLVRGKTDGKSAIKVQINKRVEVANDFFSDPKELASDGLEEESILYRIGRELQIAKALTKASEKKSR